jgi:thioredoxin-related protein
MLLAMFGFAIELLRSNIRSNFMIKWLKYPVAVTLLVLPFILNAIFWDDLTDTTDLFQEEFQTDIPNINELTALTKERVLVCFYSTSCPFCVRASKKIAVAQKRYPYFPEVFVLFQGDQYGAQYFLETAKVKFDYSVLSLEDYTKLTGLTFPRFQLVYQGNIDRKWDGQTFNFSVMNKLSLGVE